MEQIAVWIFWLAVVIALLFVVMFIAWPGSDR